MDINKRIGLLTELEKLEITISVWKSRIDNGAELNNLGKSLFNDMEIRAFKLRCAQMGKIDLPSLKGSSRKPNLG